MNYAWMTAGITSVVAFWQQIQGFLMRFVSLVVVTAEIEHNLTTPLMGYLWAHFRSVKFGVRKYTAIPVYIKAKDKHGTVAFENPGESLTFLKGWKPLFVSETFNQQKGNTMKVSFIRGMFNLEEIIVNALDEYDDKTTISTTTKRFHISRTFGRYGNKDNGPDLTEPSSGQPAELHRGRPLKWTWDQIGTPTPEEPFGALAYSSDIEAFLRHLRHWKDSKKWYKERTIPWRMGAMLTGKPGTGKSSFVRAAAQELDLPIQIFDLPSMCNEELVSAWTRMLARAPCVALFEDFDRIFDGNKQIKGGTMDKPGLTLDAILNCINGVDNSEGVIVIMTANDLSKIDPALGLPEMDANGELRSTRPGRLDSVITFGELDAFCRTKIAERILNGYPEQITKAVHDGHGETGAQFQKRCSDIAVKLYWQEFHEAERLKALTDAELMVVEDSIKENSAVG